MQTVNRAEGKWRVGEGRDVEEAEVGCAEELGGSKGCGVACHLSKKLSGSWQTPAAVMMKKSLTAGQSLLLAEL